jgi:hypothetical protein
MTTPAGSVPAADPPDPDDPATDAVVARHVRTLPTWAARWDARVLADRERLKRRAPRSYRRLLTVSAVAYLLTDAVLPRRRIRPVAVAMILATVADSVATYVWITGGVALEGNPVVATVMGTFGEGGGLVLRAVASAGFVVALAWLARRHWEARAGLAVAAAALGAITVVHAYGVLLVSG